MIGLLAVTIASGSKAGDLKGVVLVDDEGGPPASNVGVDATGANHTETDQGGKFSLRFPTRKPGDSVSLTITRPGYVVVNFLDLNTRLPSDPDVSLHKLILCTPNRRQECANRYYHLLTARAMEKSHPRLGDNKTIARANGKDVARLRAIEKRRSEAQVAADYVAAELARTKPGTTSELRQDALRLLRDGEIERARELLVRDTQEVNWWSLFDDGEYEHACIPRSDGLTLKVTSRPSSVQDQSAGCCAFLTVPRHVRRVVFTIESAVQESIFSMWLEFTGTTDGGMKYLFRGALAKERRFIAANVLGGGDGEATRLCVEIAGRGSAVRNEVSISGLNFDADSIECPGTVDSDAIPLALRQEYTPDSTNYLRVNAECQRTGGNPSRPHWEVMFGTVKFSCKCSR